MALVILGFPPDWWLPPELARHWKTFTYPTERTVESVSQWQHIQQDMARYMLAIAGREKADEYYKDLANDRELIGKFASEILPAPGAVEQPTRAGQAEGIGDQSRHERMAALQPAVRKAYLSFEAVRVKTEKKDMGDSQAYELLKEEGVPEGCQGELTDYHLPAKDTWCRYLHKARRALIEQKYTSRRGRPHGKSIARQDQISWCVAFLPLLLHPGNRMERRIARRLRLGGIANLHP
jgi:hypothetical protein